MPKTHLQDIPPSKLEALSRNTYFFGHQSVGGNIIDGLKTLIADEPALKLSFVQSQTASDLAPGVFMHDLVGKNRHPESKLEQFQSAMDAGLGGQVDIAFLKFCYIDFVKNGASPQAIFAQYQQTLASLKSRYPHTRFIHFTAPLKSMPSGVKVLVKDLIGKEIAERSENVLRANYNKLMREAYAGKEPLFDIARLESIDPATMETHTFSLDGQSYEAMAPGNTYDGGHLSESGKRWIAQQFIVFLADLDSTTANPD